MSDQPTRFVPGDSVAYVSPRTLLVTSAPSSTVAELVLRDAEVGELLEFGFCNTGATKPSKTHGNVMNLEAVRRGFG